MMKSLIPVLLLTLLFACKGNQKAAGESALTATEFSQKINEAEQPQIIDVRTRQEFEQGHIDDAKNINWNSGNFLEDVEDLDKDKPVFVYCLSGARSAAAAEAMRDHGFKQVYEMKGGLLQWRDADLPEVTNDPNENAAAGGMSRAAYDSLLSGDKLVLVDFYAEWCGPCKAMEPSLAKISGDMPDKVKIVRINIDENPAIAMSLNVSSIPNFKLYKNKELVWQHLGYIKEKELRKKLN